MMRIFLVAISTLCMFAATAQAIVLFDWAVVDQDLGNAGDVQSQGTFGSVSYAYRISKHEVTNAQYAEFLNAVDPTGTNILELYHTDMSSDARGGILQNLGNANGLKYEIKPGRDNNPVVFVNFYDTLRFANWLHNGQGSGGTETGAYTLLGGTSVPTNGNSITRNTGANFFLTTEDEWYKAAYYDPDTDSYFDYATSSNTLPTSEAPLGGVNSVNYNDIAGIGYALTGSDVFDNTFNYLTDVGAYTATISPFGTFDQNGNVWEWNETLKGITLNLESFRGQRGGGWSSPAHILEASFDNISFHTNEYYGLGFRVASPVGTSVSGAIPEPLTATLGLMGLGVLGLVTRRRAA